MQTSRSVCVLLRVTPLTWSARRVAGAQPYFAFFPLHMGSRSLPMHGSTGEDAECLLRRLWDRMRHVKQTEGTLSSDWSVTSQTVKRNLTVDFGPKD